MNSVLVFDIETIPDVSLCKELTGVESDDVQEQRKAMEEYHLKITDGKNPFLRQPFHKVIVISLLQAKLIKNGAHEALELKKIASGDISKYTEKELVQFFFDHVCKGLPRLVSFNGRTFDLPVLKYRAMKHGVLAEKFYSSGDKWSSYNNRYSADWHMDLLDILSDYGLSARVKMNEVCVAFGLPGKIGMDGSDVASCYDAGKIDQIKEYCETDVLNTYLIYLKLMRHRVRISPGSYNANIQEIKEYLQKNQKQNSYYKDFLSEIEDL